MDSAVEISVVIPVYKCKTCLAELHARLTSVLNDIEYEIIFVDDRSPDNSWEELKRLANISRSTKSFRLSRNFGQHAAIAAGMAESSGEWVVVMDCDLQDRPEEIMRLLEYAKSGHDVALACREERSDSFFRKLMSYMFYKLFAYLTETPQDSSVANFGVYSRRVIDAIMSMGDYHKYLPSQVGWVGFDIIKVPVQHDNRYAGESSYSLSTLIRLAITTSMSFSDKPLRLIVKFGMSMSLLSFLSALYVLLKYFYGTISVEGWTTLVLSIWFLAGVVITITGMIGLYVGRILEEVKGRPPYVISERLGVNSKK